METVYDAALLPRTDRFRVWQEEVCDVHVNVDVAAVDPLDYFGRVRTAQYGVAKLTEDEANSGIAKRRRTHLSKADDDDVHILFVTNGMLNIVQSGVETKCNPGMVSFFRTSEPFDLVIPKYFQSFIMEPPRRAFAERFHPGHLPEVGKAFLTGSGVGRIAIEFCHQLALEAAGLDEAVRARLGTQAMDLFALALDSRAEVDDSSIKDFRLRSIKAFIERNLENPNLTPGKIATRNNISLSYLHGLFKGSGYTVNEWVWHRRLERSYHMIASSAHSRSTITEIAETLGFSNSSHFSSLFRKKFEIRPSDLRRRKNH